MNIFLHRDDLRIHDNHGLKKASKNGKTISVYIEDPRTKKTTGKNKKAFKKQGINKLNLKYREKGSGLIYREGKTVEELQKLVKEYDIKKIFLNRSYTPVKRRIEKEINNLDTETKIFQDRLLVEPQQLSQEYDTFSPFYREWKKKEKSKPFQKPENLADVDSEVPDFIQRLKPIFHKLEKK